MVRPDRVGLFVRNVDESKLLIAAIEECGLEGLALDVTELRSVAEATETRDIKALSPIARELKWIVTDDASFDQLNQSPLQQTTFTHTPGPLIILVKDQVTGGKLPSETSPEMLDSGYFSILVRPLRVEGVRLQLEQLLRAESVLESRYRNVLNELQLAQRIFESVYSGISICDAKLPDLPLTYVNPTFEKMTGYPASESCGRNCRFLQGSDTDQPGLTTIRKAIEEQREARVLLRNYHKDGSLFWNELYMSPLFDSAGVLTHFVGIQNDVTKLVEAQERLDHLAHHDGLTGLANRGLLMEQLNMALSRAQRRGSQVAVLFFDLDNFKYANDMFGHATGDRLLQVVAGRLRAGTRASETVARLGGDEFIVVLEELSEARPPSMVMERLVSLIAEPVEIIEQEFRPSASVGMALFPADGTTAEVLIKVADFNMYTAKHEARSAAQGERESARTDKGR